MERAQVNVSIRLLARIADNLYPVQAAGGGVENDLTPLGLHASLQVGLGYEHKLE